MRVFVLGNTGMLGKYVYEYLKNKDYDITGLNRFNFNIENADAYLIYHANSIIINCIGLIPQRSINKSIYDYLKANTILPHKLQEVCEKTNSKLIHITTDCVFSGSKGFYNEYNIHNSLDIYGKTKSLGEPEKATVIRTSVIGEELQNKKSLLEWVKYNKNNEVKGYINHYWNGITCLEFAKICDKIIKNNLFWQGVKHIYSPKEFNKFYLIKNISDVYDLNMIIKPHQTDVQCNRTLSTIRKDIIFEIPDLKDQLIEQKDFGDSIFDNK
jgi:dTDP-4-dehydrorhamnose reductase